LRFLLTFHQEKPKVYCQALWHLQAQQANVWIQVSETLGKQFTWAACLSRVHNEFITRLSTWAHGR
jgi:hypothetical protein